MRKAIITAIFIILIAALVIFAIYQTQKKPRFESVVPQLLAERIDSFNFVEKYPETASDVIAAVNTINEYFYSGAADEIKIEQFVKLVRMLYSPELLKINLEERHINETILEISEFNSIGFRVNSSKVFSPEYYDNDILKCSVRSIQYTNSESNNYYIYYLSKDGNGHWKIMGWEITEQFDEGGAIGYNNFGNRDVV